MTEYEYLSIGRAVLAVVVIVFAFRGRYYLLGSAGISGLVVSILASSGVSRNVTGLLAYFLYALLAAHALDVTRRRHPRYHA